MWILDFMNHLQVAGDQQTESRRTYASLTKPSPRLGPIEQLLRWLPNRLLSWEIWTSTTDKTTTKATPTSHWSHVRMEALRKSEETDNGMTMDARSALEVVQDDRSGCWHWAPVLAVCCLATS